MRIIKLLIVFAALCVLSGCMLPREEELLPPDLLIPEEVVFRTIEVEKGTIRDILEDYVIAASAVQYEMTFHNRSGYLAEINVRTGREVMEGDVLARLDTGSLEKDIELQKIVVDKLKLVLDETIRQRGTRYARRHAEMDLEMAQISLQQLEDELEKSTIVAPVDGEIVFSAGYKIGEFVPGRSVVVTVADPSQLHFEYTGIQIGRIKYGMDAEIIIDALRIPAKVSMTPMNAPEEQWERYRNTVIFTVNDQEDLPDDVKIGARYRFSIFIEEKSDVIVIPVGAVSSFMGQHYVQILENGMRTERDIVAGITSKTHVEVMSGLEEGELLIVAIER